MRGYSEGQILRLGAITLVIGLLIIAAAFNLSKFPGFSGSTYQAEFKDASGLATGNMVQVGGIRVGRVEDIELEGNTVVVSFEVENGVAFGKESKASVEVLNLLGEKYLQLTPAGSGQLETDETIPVERTQAAYDIVGVLSDLTGTTERIDTGQLKKALNTLGETIQASGPELEGAFRGIARLSESLSGRDEELQTLLEGSSSVSRILDRRSKDIVKLMNSADLVFKELRTRKASVHRLLVNARILARELRGVAKENQEAIGPAMDELEGVLDFLIRKEKELKDTLAAYGPYAHILGNIIGTGPWFDAYVVNLAGIATGEFSRPGTVN